MTGDFPDYRWQSVWNGAGDHRLWAYNKVVVSSNSTSANWDLTVYNGWPAPAVPKQEKQEHMRGLYEVFIVDPFGTTTNEGVQRVKPGEIIYTKCVVADDENRARMKVAAAADLDKDVDDYDFLVRKIGDVRASRKK